MLLDSIGRSLEKAFEDNASEHIKPIAELLSDRKRAVSTRSVQPMSLPINLDSPIGEAFGGAFAIQDVCTSCKTERNHSQDFSKILATVFKREEAPKVRDSRKQYKDGLSKLFAPVKNQCDIKSLRWFLKEHEHMCPWLYCARNWLFGRARPRPGDALSDM